MSALLLHIRSILDYLKLKLEGSLKFRIKGFILFLNNKKDLIFFFTIAKIVIPEKRTSLRYSKSRLFTKFRRNNKLNKEYKVRYWSSYFWNLVWRIADINILWWSAFMERTMSKSNCLRTEDFTLLCFRRRKCLIKF